MPEIFLKERKEEIISLAIMFKRVMIFASFVETTKIILLLALPFLKRNVMATNEQEKG